VIYEDNLDVNLRPAVGADATAIVDLHFAAVHQTARSFYPQEVLDGWSTQPDEARYDQFRQALEKGAEVFVVAEDASGVIGFGSIVPTLQELRAVYVHPRAGRRGVGSAILSCLEQVAIDRGVLQLQMDASINAEAFHRRAGYEILERGVHTLRSGLEMVCVKLKKSLTQEIEHTHSRPAG
jgi:N-acetylglutamate synthase-like GNAT family acetyltransferase